MTLTFPAWAGSGGLRLLVPVMVLAVTIGGAASLRADDDESQTRFEAAGGRFGWQTFLDDDTRQRFHRYDVLIKPFRLTRAESSEDSGWRWAWTTRFLA